LSSLGMGALCSDDRSTLTQKFSSEKSCRKVPHMLCENAWVDEVSGPFAFEAGE